MKTIDSLDALLVGEPHYAVLEFSTMHIPGDQRSIDAPGHGYPAHDEKVTRYVKFDNLNELEAYLARKSRYDQYIVLKSERLRTETRTVVEIGK